MNEKITAGETSISFKESEDADCELELVLSVDNEHALRGSLKLSFEEAESFIKELQKELEQVKGEQ